MCLMHYNVINVRIGHHAAGCKTTKRCLICGGNHSRINCPDKGGTNFKCGKGKGSHSANSKQFAFIKQAQNIESIRAFQNVSYVEARDIVIKKSRPSQENPNHRNIIRNYTQNR